MISLPVWVWVATAVAGLVYVGLLVAEHFLKKNKKAPDRFKGGERNGTFGSADGNQ